MPIIELTGFRGANQAEHARFLPSDVGVASVNQKPSITGELEPWRVPLSVSGVSVVSGAISLYRMGRESQSDTSYWLSWAAHAHVIRGFDATDTTERTYYTDGVAPKWTDNIQATATPPYPTASRLLAVPQPDTAPTVTLTADGATGDPRQPAYIYTWVNDIGWESPPSPPTISPPARPGAVLALGATATVPPGNYGLATVRWYRTEVVDGTTSELFFLREYAIGASGMEDDGRALTQEQLKTESWLNLDASATWLTACWNQFAAAIVGKAVRCCEPNFMYAWPLDYEYLLSSKPLAMAAFAQRLLVLTSDGAEVLTGSDPAGLDQKPLSLPVIVSPRSLVSTDMGAMWAAADGLMYYGVEGFRNLTAGAMRPEQWRALHPETMHGYQWRGLYIGFYFDGADYAGIVVDPSNPRGVYKLDAWYRAGFWDALLRELFVLDGGTLRKWDAGASFMTATFTSKVNRENSDTEAEWFEVLGDGQTQVRLLVDGVERMNRTVLTGQHRVPDGAAGRDWQAVVSTDGRLQGIVVE